MAAAGDESDWDFYEFAMSSALIKSNNDLLAITEAVEPVLSTLVTEQLNKLSTLSTTIASNVRESHPKQVGFSEHLDQKDEVDFFRNLRLTRKTFSQLLDVVEDHYQPVYRGGYLPVTAKASLQMCLWYLGNKATYREIAELFGLTESTVFNCVQNMITIINSLGPVYIQWPTGETVKEVETKFNNIAGFPGAIGAVDGCHIEIKAPDDVQADFIDRTNRHSVNLMAVCDSEKRFTFINAGFPGSAHDSRVLKATRLYQLMLNEPDTVFPSNYYHIIGDSAFQLTNQVLVPFKDYGNLTEREKKYNKKLSQTRCVVENAFGFLKGRFRRLKYIDAELHRIPSIIKACCILHNITIKNPTEEDFLCNEGEIAPEIGQADPLNEPVHLPDVGGVDKRNFIAGLL